MKKLTKFCFGITVAVIFMIVCNMPLFSLAQDSSGAVNKNQLDSTRYVLEPGWSGGSGYMFDYSGGGGYTYNCPSLMLKKGNLRFGLFANLTNVYVKFNDYTFRATEITVGPAIDGWGKLNENFTYAFWAQPGFKVFKDHGYDVGKINEAWQNDRGFYGVFGANINDKLNRWFRSYKVNIMYQKPFWSRKTGMIEGEKLNFKATNKSYFKVQFESTGRKICRGKSRWEPKLVLGYLYDGGSQKDLFEYGTGIALSFSKGDRYFEVANGQYRLRYGTNFGQPFHVFEVGFDLINFFRLVNVVKK